MGTQKTQIKIDRQKERSLLAKDSGLVSGYHMAAFTGHV